MSDSQDSILQLIRSFALRCGPHRIVDFEDALTAFRGDHIAALLEALGDDDDEVRLFAVEALYSFGQKAEPALPYLIEALKDEDRLVRVAAVGCVSAFGQKAIAAVPILEGWLSSDDDFCSVAAAGAIVRITPVRVDDVLPVLIGALDNCDLGIRCHTAWHLGQLGPVAREALPALKRMVGEESTLDRLVSEAIVSITGHRPQ